ncbi:MAG TPA: CusA/CzcA family heavy metal efflux RND transporter [Elusimicrobia bacterium]|nr:MAG: cation transporter [Elusimicrobia bacterium GWA2_66_18]HAZ09270.1 CusA/CzcA family heavy metal efflux RND transporter [Elusimicrobiota bacterium]
MVERMIAWSARNKFIVIALVAVALAGAVYCMKNSRLDAIPDLSDTQVIIYSRWDRSPDILEDQVTYPIVTAMLGAPGVKAIRGFSDFGYSYVYVIFQDGTDVYWARSRTLEYLSKILPQLPEGVRTELGPDATGVGWVYQYALVDKSGRHSLADLRGYQDWYLRYYLQSVPGVAEVASIGGFQKQYQVNVDPNALVAYKVPLMKVVSAIRDGNNDVGGRMMEFSGREYMVRGRGYIKSVADIENIVVGRDMRGTPILVRSLGHVALGPDIRRGVADLDGEGDTVGGVVVMRYGENALHVIERVKKKLDEVKGSLPPGVEVLTTYDRSSLIERAIGTLKEELLLELVIVSLVILLFLWHIPTAIIPIVTIPVAVILTFIPMYFMGLTSNIMSISGIAISIGILVDGAIVEVENAYKKLQLWIEGGRQGDFHEVRLKAMQQVGPAVFFSLLVIAVAFMPIFTLMDQEGRLFKPLAYTKNLAMAIAAVLAITFDPAIRMMFSRMDYFTFKPKWLAWVSSQVLVGRYYPEEKHPVSKVLFRFYEPACRFVLEHPYKTILAAVLLVLSTIPVYLRLGSEFMPPLNEGTILYMPTTLPGISVTEARSLLQTQDQILKSFPEVERVFGKAGRVESSTDPAPFSMMETTVVLKPHGEWRKKARWYSPWAAELLQRPLRHVWDDRLSWEELVAEMDAKLQFPGVTNAWTMPIKGRIDMLTTGVRTPIGIKLFGSDLGEIERVGVEIESAIKDVPGTRSVYAERTAGGYFVDFDLKRDQLARYGLSVKEAEMVIMSALGGESVTTTVEGRERYSVSVRYARDLRDNLPKLQRVLVPTMSGAQVPLAQIADIRLRQGPGMIRNENGLLSGYVYVDVAGRDIGGYVEEAKKLVSERVRLPVGYALQWSGQYENMARVRERLKVVLPLTFVIIIFLLYMNTKSWVKTGIVMMAVPFSLIGAVWLLFLLGYNVSIAVWVGMIALMGLDAETGVFMLLYLDLAYYDMVRQGRMRTYADLEEAVIYGAVKRIRPKLMTVACAFMGLAPIMWSVGTGADLMKRIAAPMVGGLFTSFILELLVYPPVFFLWKWHFEMRQGAVLPEKIPIPELQAH